MTGSRKAAKFQGREDDLWYEVRKDDWRIRFRVEHRDGVLVVAELQIAPEDRDALPPGGLTTTSLHRVRVEKDLLAELRRAMREAAAALPSRGYDAKLQRFVKELAESEDPFHAQHGAFAGLDRAAGRRGRRQKPPIFYARIARTYVDALERGHKPIVKVAIKHTNGNVASARELVSRARKYGFLSRTQKGRAGGVLMPLALSVLAGADERARQARERRGKR